MRAVTDSVDSGLEAGDQKQPNECRELRWCDRAALLGDECRYQIIARLGCPFLEQLGKGGPQFSVCGRLGAGLA